MSCTRIGVTVLLVVVLAGDAYVLSPKALADAQEKPMTTEKNSAKQVGKPSIFSQVHKGLKSLDTKIPAETSKAAKATKEGFQKRSNTTHEQKTDTKEKK